MHKKRTPQEILAQISLIDRMEPGHLSVIRETANGALYNLQRRDDGKNHTEYIPREQVFEVQKNVEAFRRFQSLVKEYADVIADKTRSERQAGAKKNARSPGPASLTKRKSPI